MIRCIIKTELKEAVDMQAYEFYALPDNGAILIPEQYKNKIKS